MVRIKSLAVGTLMLAYGTALAQKSSVTQHKWEEYEWVDTCTERYAVVHDWIGRCGIYDLEKKKNLTELDYRELRMSRMMNLENGHKSAVFYGKIGRREGAIVLSQDDNVMSITRPDSDLIYNLDSCRTIDQKMTGFCNNLMKKAMVTSDSVQYGQIMVMDTQTGDIKAWVALEDAFFNEKPVEAELRKHQCSAKALRDVIAVFFLRYVGKSLDDTVDLKNGVDSVGKMLIKEDEWYEGNYGLLTYRNAILHHSAIAAAKAIHAGDKIRFREIWEKLSNSPRDADALAIASIYSSIATPGQELWASTNTDSIRMVRVHEDSIPLASCREIIQEMVQRGYRSPLASGSIKSTKKQINYSGDYTIHHNCPPTLYDDNAGSLEKFYTDNPRTYDQVIFTGYMPSDNPRYTFCITLEKKGAPANVTTLQDSINKLVKYLNKNVIKNK